jgi:ABC-type transport system substrate-binding protein
VARQVESATATDKYTVVIQLKEPNPRFHYENFCDLWGSLWVMPKHVFEQFMVNGQVDTEAFFAFEYNPPLSSGPYVLHSFDPPTWTAWVKRDDWAKTHRGGLWRAQAEERGVRRLRGLHRGHQHDPPRGRYGRPGPSRIRAAIKADPSARGYYENQDFLYQSNRHPASARGVQHFESAVR